MLITCSAKVKFVCGSFVLSFCTFSRGTFNADEERFVRHFAFLTIFTIQIQIRDVRIYTIVPSKTTTTTNQRVVQICPRLSKNHFVRMSANMDTISPARIAPFQTPQLTDGTTIIRTYTKTSFSNNKQVFFLQK